MPQNQMKNALMPTVCVCLIKYVLKGWIKTGNWQIQILNGSDQGTKIVGLGKSVVRPILGGL